MRACNPLLQSGGGFPAFLVERSRKGAAIGDGGECKQPVRSCLCAHVATIWERASPCLLTMEAFLSGHQLTLAPFGGLANSPPSLIEAPDYEQEYKHMKGHTDPRCLK